MISTSKPHFCSSRCSRLTKSFRFDAPDLGFIETSIDLVFCLTLSKSERVISVANQDCSILHGLFSELFQSATSVTQPGSQTASFIEKSKQIALAHDLRCLIATGTEMNRSARELLDFFAVQLPCP